MIAPPDVLAHAAPSQNQLASRATAVLKHLVDSHSNDAKSSNSGGAAGTKLLPKCSHCDGRPATIMLGPCVCLALCAECNAESDQAIGKVQKGSAEEKSLLPSLTRCPKCRLNAHLHAYAAVCLHAMTS